MQILPRNVIRAIKWRSEVSAFEERSNDVFFEDRYIVKRKDSHFGVREISFMMSNGIKKKEAKSMLESYLAA